MGADLKAQLAVLRRRVTRINNKYQGPGAGGQALDTALGPVAVIAGPEVFPISGEVIENDAGRFFLSEKSLPAHRRHGNVEFSRLSELAPELLQAISGGELPGVPARRWAFLDTETTGLAGGTGTCAFLIGVGTVDETGFRVHLFFMRDYDEEPAMLAGLAALLADYDVLITYNGKAYDAPLLESRYRLARQRCPLQRLAHLDVLFAARRLWKLRLETCRLVELEREILGVEREGDLPGELIPYYYFEYLRNRQAFKLVPLFHHNTMDILSLAALTAVVLPVFAAPSEANFRHGEDLLGIARWLRQNARPEDALAVYRQAIARRITDQNLFRALWEMAAMEKRLGRQDQAVAIWCDLASARNEFRRHALQELAKHYEHRERNYGMALDMTAAALAVERLPELERRRARLERKAAAQSRRLV